MALALIHPAAYAALLEKHQGTPRTLFDAERELFGMDHCETGRQLIGDWKLPKEFESVVAQHHEARRTDGAWDLTELVKVSCAMASSIGFAAFPGCETTSFSELMETLPARERRLFRGDAETLKKEVAESIRAIESV